MVLCTLTAARVDQAQSQSLRKARVLRQGPSTGQEARVELEGLKCPPKADLWAARKHRWGSSEKLSVRKNSPSLHVSNVTKI